jgi:hypothetical protein
MPRPQFSIRTLLWLTLVVAAFLGGIGLERERQRREVLAGEFVSIAVIDLSCADQVRGVLGRAGIESIIEGSVVYGVLVPVGAKSRAVSLLRADSAAHNYWIEF